MWGGAISLGQGKAPQQGECLDRRTKDSQRRTCSTQSVTPVSTGWPRRWPQEAASSCSRWRRVRLSTQHQLLQGTPSAPIHSARIMFLRRLLVLHTWLGSSNACPRVCHQPGAPAPRAPCSSEGRARAPSKAPQPPSPRFRLRQGAALENELMQVVGVPPVQGRELYCREAACIASAAEAWHASRAGVPPCCRALSK